MWSTIDSSVKSIARMPRHSTNQLIANVLHDAHFFAAPRGCQHLKFTSGVILKCKIEGTRKPMDTAATPPVSSSTAPRSVTFSAMATEEPHSSSVIT